MHFWPWSTCMYFSSLPVRRIFVEITFLWVTSPRVYSQPNVYLMEGHPVSCQFFSLTFNCFIIVRDPWVIFSIKLCVPPTPLEHHRHVPYMNNSIIEMLSTGKKRNKEISPTIWPCSWEIEKDDLTQLTNHDGQDHCCDEPIFASKDTTTFDTQRRAERLFNQKK